MGIGDRHVGGHEFGGCGSSLNSGVGDSCVGDVASGAMTSTTRGLAIVLADAIAWSVVIIFISIFLLAAFGGEAICCGSSMLHHADRRPPAWVCCDFYI